MANQDGGGILDAWMAGRSAYPPGQSPLDRLKAAGGDVSDWWRRNVLQEQMQPNGVPVGTPPAQIAGTPQYQAARAPMGPPAPPALAPQPGALSGSPQGLPAYLTQMPPKIDNEQPAALNPAMVSGAVQAASPMQAPALQQAPGPMGNKGALYDGMINAGVGMMRGKNFQESIANGFEGFNQGYDTKVATDKAMKTPKVTPLPDGTFSLLVYPDGTQKVVPNKDVQQYLGDQADKKTVAGTQSALLQSKLTQDNQAASLNHKTAISAGDDLQQSQQALSGYQKGLDIVNSQAGSLGAKVQGIPGIKTMAEFFGTDDAAKNQFLQSLTVNDALLETAKTKGAISDTEMRLFKSPLPSLSADREKVWKPYLQERIKAMNKVAAYQQSLANGGTPQASPAAPQQSAGKYDLSSAGVDPAYASYYKH